MLKHILWLAVGTPLIASALTAQQPDRQAQTSPVTSPLATFEVSTVKPVAPSPDGHVHIVYPPDGSFSASNITLSALMQWAFDTPSRQILEGPAWLGSTRFDIQAKSDAGTDNRLRAMSGEEGRDLKRRMVQQMLEDRFALKTHRETRLLPAYDLVLAKGGPKLQLTKSSGRSVGTGSSHFDGQGLTTNLIAEQLSQITERVVIDKTGLTERYDLKLLWTPDNTPPTEGSPPSLFTAIQEQLGLRLENAKEAVPVIVIDSIQPPTPN